MDFTKHDQFYINIKIKSHGEVISPDSIDDIRVQVGDYLKQYSKGELPYDSEFKCYKFFLTQDMTMELKGHTIKVQVGVKKGDVIKYAPLQLVFVDDNIIKGVW